MKTRKLFFALAVAIIAFASCSRENNDYPSNMEGDINNVHVTIHQGDLTRAFFGDSPVPEAWEKKINKLLILVFSNETGLYQLYREVTQAEIVAGSFSFALPGSFANKSYTFYALANSYVSLDKNSTMTFLEQVFDTGTYNGTIQEVTSKSVRSSGFTMSDKCQATINPDNATNLTFTLKRTVAKVAIVTTVSQEFVNKYPGRIVIDNIRVSRSAVNTKIFEEPTVTNYSAMTYAYSQKSGIGVISNLFYLYENPKLDASQRVLLTLTGFYDKDSVLETTDDQTPVEYVVRLNDADEGVILRNSYYRIQLAITGFSGNSVNASVIVSDWSNPINIIEQLGD